MNAHGNWCPHVLLVHDPARVAAESKNAAEQDGGDEEDQAEIKEHKHEDPPPLRTLISQRPVIYPLPDDVKARLKAGCDTPASLPRPVEIDLPDGQKKRVIRLCATVPPGTTCDCGHLYVHSAEFWHRYGDGETTVYYPTTTAKVEMYALKCPARKCTKHYEGESLCLRVCSSETVISEWVFVSCFLMVSTGVVCG